MLHQRVVALSAPMRLKNGRQTVVLKTAAPLPKVLIQKAARMREPTGARVSPNPWLHCPQESNLIAAD